MNPIQFRLKKNESNTTINPSTWLDIRKNYYPSEGTPAGRKRERVWEIQVQTKKSAPLIKAIAPTDICKGDFEVPSGAFFLINSFHF